MHIVHYFSGDKVELLDPPFNSEPGECVFVEGYERKTLGGKSDTILSHPLFTTLDLVLTSVTVVCYDATACVSNKVNVPSSSAPNFEGFN